MEVDYERMGVSTACDYFSMDFVAIMLFTLQIFSLQCFIFF